MTALCGLLLLNTVVSTSICTVTADADDIGIQLSSFKQTNGLMLGAKHVVAALRQKVLNAWQDLT